ncbi:hypothetical protein RCJ22_01940, partial [Vibrio sp. FNV 38]|nr:hypothetical protein [Vibrio sp. FNV 38]
IWESYRERLAALAARGLFSLPNLPEYATNNAHMFYLVFPDLERRTKFIADMKALGVQCVFHYLALHSSPFYADKHDGRALPNCDRFADCLVRLPLFFELDVTKVLEGVAATCR